MLALLLILVFMVQAEVTGVISVGEPAATPSETATPVITPAIAPTPTPAAYPNLHYDNGIEWMIIAIVAIVAGLAALLRKVIK